MATHASRVATSFLYIARFSDKQFKFGITDAPKRRITIDYGTLVPEGMIALYVFEHPEARKLESNLQSFLDMRGVLCHHSASGRPSEVADVGEGDEHMLAAVAYCTIARANLVHTEFKHPMLGARARVGGPPRGSTKPPRCSEGDSRRLRRNKAPLAPDCAPWDWEELHGLLFARRDPASDDVFTIELDTVRRFIGSERNALLRNLRQSYDEGIDYVIREPSTRASKHGGHNKQIVLVSPRTFNRMAMKSHSDEAQRVRDFFSEYHQEISGGTEAAGLGPETVERTRESP